MKPTSTKELQLYNTNEDTDIEISIPLTVHLAELRNKIIVSFIILCITTFIGFISSKEIIRLLTNIAPDETMFLQIKPGEFFFISLKVALYCGLVLALPIIIWQLVSFILPGLTKKERKATIPILFSAPFLFCLGAIFAYYFVAPSMVNFLFGFGKEVIPSSISIESFISFTMMIMAVCGFVFLLPVIIFALASAGMVNHKILLNKWRYAILASLILGAILTPTPDPFNMGIISGILISLYFLSCGVLRVVNK